MARQFENGVKWYTRGTVTLHFPEKAVCCANCPLIRSMEGGIQHICRLSGEILHNLNRIGDHCPVDYWEEDEHET